jgi:predicted GNAT family N-acyltransferase
LISFIFSAEITGCIQLAKPLSRSRFGRMLISHSRRCENNGHGFLQKTIQNARGAKSNRDDRGTGRKEYAHNRFLPTLFAKSSKEPKSGS